MAAQLALAETHVIQETKGYFEQVSIINYLLYMIIIYVKMLSSFIIIIKDGPIWFNDQLVGLFIMFLKFWSIWFNLLLFRFYY